MGTRRTSSRGGSEREVAAVMSNMKEQRALEKRVHMLNLEQNFTSKLHDLDHKLLMVGYRRLQERVSRIKSYLTAEQIQQMRRLEAKGRMKTSHSVINVGGAVKIAAAARRLGVGMPRRPQTAIPTTSRSSSPPISINNKPTQAKPRPATARESRSDQDRARLKTPPPSVLRDHNVGDRKETQKGRGGAGRCTTFDVEDGFSTDKTHKSAITRKQTPRPTIRPASANDIITSRGNCKTVMLIKNREKMMTPDIAMSSGNFIGSTPNMSQHVTRSREHERKDRPPGGDTNPHNFKLKVNTIVEDKSDVGEKEDSSTACVEQITPIEAVRIVNSPKLPDSSNNNSIYPINSQCITLNQTSTDETGSAQNAVNSNSPIKDECSATSGDITNRSLPKMDSPNGIDHLFSRKISIDDENGNNENSSTNTNSSKFEERRRSLIEMENVRVMALQERQSDFLDRIDRCVEENPVHTAGATEIDPRHIMQTGPQFVQPESSSESGGSRVNSASRCTPKHQPHRSPVDREELLKLMDARAWKDINKCRYLRVNPELIDLSGVNTLARDQMHMINFLRVVDQNANMKERFNPTTV